MLLTAGDRLVIGAALAQQSMTQWQQADVYQKAGNPIEAQKWRAFSAECARLAEMFNPALKNRLAR